MEEPRKRIQADCENLSTAGLIDRLVKGRTTSAPAENWWRKSFVIRAWLQPCRKRPAKSTSGFSRWGTPVTAQEHLRDCYPPPGHAAISRAASTAAMDWRTPGRSVR